MKDTNEIREPQKVNTADPEMDVYDDGELYCFPDLHMCVAGCSSEERAREIALQTIEEMEMDGFTRDADGNFHKPPEPPWYDDGRKEGEPKKKYRWREMFKLYRQLGRPLTAEETEPFEIKEDTAPHEAAYQEAPSSSKADDVPHGIEYYLEDGRLTEPSDGKMYRWREMIEYSRQLGRPLTAEEEASFEVKDWEDEGRQS